MTMDAADAEAEEILSETEALELVPLVPDQGEDEVEPG